jgi:hypothetical protein
VAQSDADVDIYEAFSGGANQGKSVGKFLVVVQSAYSFSHLRIRIHGGV